MLRLQWIEVCEACNLSSIIFHKPAPILMSIIESLNNYSQKLFYPQKAILYCMWKGWNSTSSKISETHVRWVGEIWGETEVVKALPKAWGSAQVTPKIHSKGRLVYMKCVCMIYTWYDIYIYMSARQTSDILEQLHQDIDTWYHHETLRNDRGDTKNDDSWYTCSPDFIANIKSSGTMRDTQKTMTISATSFRGCNRFSPLLIYI